MFDELSVLAYVPLHRVKPCRQNKNSGTMPFNGVRHQAFANGKSIGRTR